MTLEQLWEQYVETDLWRGITELELFNAKNAFLTGAAAYAKVQASVLEIGDEKARYDGLVAMADWIGAELDKMNQVRDTL